ncbi:MAG: response regulator [Bdellovibrionales bacterium]|nr:response regulator [Bdellovibrionales bacterium]
MSQNEGTANRPIHQIYVIDDEPDIMLIVTEFLSPRQYEVTAFNSAPELLEAVRTRPPLAVITDFKMPEITGIEVVRAIREFDQKIRLAILTGFADKDLAIESLNSGVNDLIEKPVTAKKLLDIIEKYRDHREAEEKNEQNEIAEIRGIFLEEARDLYAEIDNEILKLEDIPLDRNVVDSLFRRVHSVKGGSGSVPGAQRLSKMSHEFENALSMIRKGQITPNGGMIDVFLTAADCSRQLFNFIESQTQPDEALESEIQQIESALQALQRNDEPAVETGVSSDKTKSSASKSESAQDKDDGILVPNERLDDFMRLSGELIVLKNTFDQVASHDESFQDITQLRRRLGDLMVNLNKMTDELQSLIVSVRKVPLEKALSKVPRLVRQTARTTGKKVALETAGLEMGVDKNLSKALSQCLTHMVRNSVDHGIEAPEERVRSGKSDTGTITIAANESQGVIRVTVSDDGKGINRDKVLRKAVSAGLIEDSQAQSLKDDEIFALLFEP